MGRLQKLERGTVFTLQALGQPGNQKGLRECLHLGLLEPVGAEYSVQGELETSSIFIIKVQNQHIAVPTGATGEDISQSRADVDRGNTACFALDAQIWGADSKEHAGNNAGGPRPAHTLRAEDWVRTTTTDNEERPCYVWTQIKCVWRMLVPTGFTISDIRGNQVTSHHAVSVDGKAWGPASAFGKEVPYAQDTVLNFSLVGGGNLILANEVFSATLGYSLDMHSSRPSPMYSGERARILENILGSEQEVLTLTFNAIQANADGELIIDTRGIIESIFSTPYRACWTGGPWSLAPVADSRAGGGRPITSLPTGPWWVNIDLVLRIFQSQEAEAKWFAQLRMLRGVNREWRMWSNMVYPDNTHKVTVHGPNQFYTGREGAHWGASHTVLLLTRMEFSNEAHVTCSGTVTPDYTWLQTAWDAVVQDAVTFDMHATMQHLMVCVLKLLRTKAQGLVDPPNWQLYMSGTHILTLLEVLRRHVLALHPYTLQRTQSQSLSAAASQLATDTLSLLEVAFKSVNPDGEHLRNAWQGMVGRDDCLTLARTAQLSWESNPLHKVDEQGRREGQQEESYAPLAGMNILWLISLFSEGYGNPGRHTLPLAEMLDLTLDALQRISSHADDGGQRREETEPPTLRLRMLTQVIQAGLAFQMRNSQDPARRHLRWSLLQRSTFEGLIRLHVHPESDESISEQNITNCVLLRGLLVMLCAQDDSFRSLRGEDAGGGSVRDLVLNHFMYALHLHEGIETDEHYTILQVGAMADAEFDLATYWTHPNSSAVPIPRLGSVMATIGGPRGGGYDDNLLVFLLWMMETCHRNNTGNFSGVVTCLEWIFALTHRAIPQSQFLEAGGIQRVMDGSAKKWGDTEIAERGRSVLVMRARYRSARLTPHQRGWTDAG